jgi:hypothetical protein
MEQVGAREGGAGERDVGLPLIPPDDHPAVRRADAQQIHHTAVRQRRAAILTRIRVEAAGDRPLQDAEVVSGRAVGESDVWRAIDRGVPQHEVMR